MLFRSKRLAANFEDKNIVFLEKNVCYCSTMNRIDLPHLVFTLETLAAGRLINQIQVTEKTKAEALLALNQMLELA